VSGTTPFMILDLTSLFGIKSKITKRLSFHLLGYPVTVKDLVVVALELSPT
jgi:hypothetical protein